MSFVLLFSSKSARQIKKLPKSIKKRIKVACEEIKKDPWHRGTIKVEGYRNIRRKRIGNFRILYMVDKGGKEIIVVKIEKRSKETYKL